VQEDAALLFRAVAMVIATMLPGISVASAAGPLSLTFGSGDAAGSTATATQQQTTPIFTGAFAPATVLSAVNVRSGPSSQGTEIVGTLHEGETVSARCLRGWCELEGNAGYTAQKFLSFGGADSFAVLGPPSEEASIDTALAPDPGATAVANFDGLWTVIDADGNPGMPLILTQTGASVTGTLQSKERLAKIVGDVEGNKLSFTYDMLDSKGRAVASGNGFLNLKTGGSALSGVMMLNGLVISNISASR
jgi:hypothetical protein